MACIVAVIVLGGGALASARGAGDLDRSFGDGGARVVKRVNDIAGAVDVGRKGRIVAAGYETVVRLRPDGRLDRSFSSDGIVRLGFGANLPLYAAGPGSVAIGHKGAVFVAGWDCPSTEACEFVVTKLKGDGELDSSFGNDGTARIGFGTPIARALSIAVSRHGKVVVAGNSCESRSSCELAVARLNRRGRLDRSFGDGGKVLLSLGCEGRTDFRRVGRAMGLDSRRRIVVGASCRRHITSLARLKPNGHLDRSFVQHGVVTKHSRIIRIEALAIDPKDRIDVAGSAGHGYYALLRFGRQGRLNRSFGHRGTARIRLPAGHLSRAPSPNSVQIDSRGHIVLGGTASNRFGFARFTRHGKVDRAFGERGRVVLGLAFGNRVDGADSMALDPHDRPVGVGVNDDHPMVVRLRR